MKTVGKTNLITQIARVVVAATLVLLCTLLGACTFFEDKKGIRFEESPTVAGEPTKKPMRTADPLPEKSVIPAEIEVDFSQPEVLADGTEIQEEPTAGETEKPEATPIPEKESADDTSAVATPTPTPKPAYYLNYRRRDTFGGGVVQLIAYSYSDDNEVKTTTWSSSDEKRAIVDEYGVVIGLKKGSSTITATANNGTDNTATCKVVVSSDRPKSKKNIDYYFLVFDGEEKVDGAEAKKVKSMVASYGKTAGEKIAKSAVGYVGHYYGTLEGNIDCSMLTLFACLDNGLFIPRRADWQAYKLKEQEVKKTELLPGDLLFFAYPEGVVCNCSTAPECKRYNGIHHVAMYLGEADGLAYVCEASSAVGKVCIRRWDSKTGDHAGMKLVCCGRPADLEG